MKIKGSLFNIPIVNNILFYDTINSTNDKAKELARRGSVHGSLVVAKTQTAGKGRLGRSFESKSDEGLYFSLLLRPDVSPEHLPGITLITALAVSKAIDQYCDVKTNIKWPNDIYFNNKKLAGILTEAGSDYVVIGIGINVNTNSFPKCILNTATSLFLETGTNYLKEMLLESILLKFDNLYSNYVIADDLTFIMNDYNNSLNCLGKEVFIIPQHRTLESSNPDEIITTDLESYTCLGIDRYGNLLCEDSFGNKLYVNSGEVSLRIK